VKYTGGQTKSILKALGRQIVHIYNDRRSF